MSREGRVAGSELKRLSYLSDALMHFKEQLGDRLLETKNLFGPVTLIDPHTHSDLCDGRGSVAQNYETAMACGLDFIFITDHDTIESRQYARMMEGISWGQEPVCDGEHVVILKNHELFDPAAFDADSLYAAAEAAGALAFIPHPAGQGIPSVLVDERAVRLIRMAGREFIMEVINGVFKLFRSWDECDEMAVGIWDRLLQGGCRVVPLGGSDAHDPFGIGTAWTGVFCDGMSSGGILEAIRAGRCFASEAPMLDFSCCGVPAGGILTGTGRMPLEFTFRVADFCGLRRVRLISDGATVKSWELNDAPVFEESWQCAASGGRTYFRLEAVSRDDRRGFSSPLYLLP